MNQPGKYIPETIPLEFYERVGFNKLVGEPYIVIGNTVHYGDSTRDLWDWTYGEKGELEWEKSVDRTGPTVIMN
jgi:hypothetical protein